MEGLTMLNKYEGKIVKTFAESLDHYENEQMELIWEDGSKIVATFDTCFEDENDYEMDEEGYEEFTSFVFQAEEVSGNPPVELSDEGFFLINYHNFPKEILVGGKKIN